MAISRRTKIWRGTKKGRAIRKRVVSNTHKSWVQRTGPWANKKRGLKSKKWY
jgi:hypothetical protein